MAGPIYKFYMLRATEAWYQLSKQEQSEFMARNAEALAAVGGKHSLALDTLWSSEQWAICGIAEFPDIEAVQKHAKLLLEMDCWRYLEATTILGTRYGES